MYDIGICTATEICRVKIVDLSDYQVLEFRLGKASVTLVPREDGTLCVKLSNNVELDVVGATNILSTEGINVDAGAVVDGEYTPSKIHINSGETAQIKRSLFAKVKDVLCLTRQ